jgi:hypothetical protein
MSASCVPVIFLPGTDAGEVCQIIGSFKLKITAMVGSGTSTPWLSPQRKLKYLYSTQTFLQNGRDTLKHQPNTILCTVGTSLFKNLGNLNINQFDHIKPEGRTAGDFRALQSSGLLDYRKKLNRMLESVITHFQNREPERLAKALAFLPPELFLLGAEINSMEVMIRKSFLGEHHTAC